MSLDGALLCLLSVWSLCLQEGVAVSDQFTHSKVLARAKDFALQGGHVEKEGREIGESLAIDVHENAKRHTRINLSKKCFPLRVSLSFSFSLSLSLYIYIYTNIYIYMDRIG